MVQWTYESLPWAAPLLLRPDNTTHGTGHRGVLPAFHGAGDTENPEFKKVRLNMIKKSAKELAEVDAMRGMAKLVFGDKYDISCNSSDMASAFPCDLFYGTYFMTLEEGTIRVVVGIEKGFQRDRHETIASAFKISDPNCFEDARKFVESVNLKIAALNKGA